MSSKTKWQKQSFLISWNQQSNRQKREIVNHLVTGNSAAMVNNLKSGTEYKIAVSTYVEETKSSGEAKEIMVSTRDDVAVAGLMGNSVCTVIVLKIACCITVILGSATTVFIFIATRMFYMDCLSQMFAELGTLGAYVSILVSSAQSYSIDSQCLRAHPTLCVTVSVLIQFFFQVVFLFLFLESLFIASTLREYIPSCCSYNSPLGLALSGFGFPTFMMIVLATVASDGFSDGNDNCWLDLQGKAMLPSVVPAAVFATLCCLFLITVMGADELKEDLSNQQRMRGRMFLKTRWSCFVILSLVTICYSTGMVGANDRNQTLNYVFIGVSTILGILMPVVRISCDDEVREQLKRGLFTSLRDNMNAIRVSPAPDEYALNTGKLNLSKYKQQQLEDLRCKVSLNSETVWHQ